ncbi:divergent PAP2 family protein [Acutalibacter sp. 1XD8-33]|uniref:divergent PAP2 family protein n=1 Tax=Acutalibacter sp. 1XD8-33 TaxID=2320081 RepID=UPI000EA0229F|nr:divergent PAP2 family protein [Acutalibacter sp. 1XD8-33]RKJ40357.1 divergent PAP2 family protein [Acutalibacter sp. 1XD8-33]
MDLSILLSNPLINISVISWAAAQALKTLVDAVKHKQFDRHRLAGAGGMPSSHSAVTCSVLLTSYYLYGFNSPIFALSFVLALIVMYDATGVRWAAGLHARAINHIVEFLEQEDATEGRQALRELIPKLNESLGHRVREAICGAGLGFLIAVIAHIIRRGGISWF